MVEAAGSGSLQDGGGGAADEAVKHHRHTGAAGADNGTSDGRQLETAQAAQNLQWIAERGAVKCRGGGDSIALARQASIVDSSATSHPVGRVAAEQRRR